jgi:hypothetical protein
VLADFSIPIVPNDLDERRYGSRVPQPSEGGGCVLPHVRIIMLELAEQQHQMVLDDPQSRSLDRTRDLGRR